MGKFILRTLVKTLLGRLLNEVGFDELIDFIGKAERDHDNDFKKRGEVYRAIKEFEVEDHAQFVINLAVELGVYAYKRLI